MPGRSRRETNSPVRRELTRNLSARSLFFDPCFRVLFYVWYFVSKKASAMGRGLVTRRGATAERMNHSISARDSYRIGSHRLENCCIRKRPVNQRSRYPATASDSSRSSGNGKFAWIHRTLFFLQ